MIKAFVFMWRIKYDKALFVNCNVALNHWQNIYKYTLAFKLFNLFHFTLLYNLTLLFLLTQNLLLKFVELRIRYLLANDFLVGLMFIEVEPEGLKEWLLFYILLLEVVTLGIFGVNEDRLKKAFAIILRDQIKDRPFNLCLFLLLVDEIFGIEGIVVLRTKEFRRPPSFKALQKIPFLLP